MMVDHDGKIRMSCGKFRWDQVVVPGPWTARVVLAGRRVPGPVFSSFDGTVWTTDKDRPIMDLLAGEIAGRTGKDPGPHYRELTKEFGTTYYTRNNREAAARQLP